MYLTNIIIKNIYNTVNKRSQQWAWKSNRSEDNYACRFSDNTSELWTTEIQGSCSMER